MFCTRLCIKFNILSTILGGFNLFERKEKFNYFDSFIELAQLAQEMAEILETALDNYPKETLSRSFEKIFSLEENVHKIVDSIKNHLKEELIPPINREDIYILICHYMEIIQGIQRIYESYYIFQLEVLMPEMLDYTRFLKNILMELVTFSKQYQEFKRFKSIDKKLREISCEIQNQDKFYRQSMYRFYQPGRELSQRQLLCYTKIFDSYRKVLDSVDRTLFKMEEIMIKES